MKYDYCFFYFIRHVKMILVSKQKSGRKTGNIED
jgi:hypothetical protein